MKPYPLYTHGKSLLAILTAIPIVFLLVGHAVAGDIIGQQQQQKQQQLAIAAAIAAVAAYQNAQLNADQATTFNAPRDASAPSIAGGSFGFGAAAAPGCPQWMIGRGKGGSLGGSVNISNSGLNSGGGLVSYGTNYALLNLICNNQTKMAEAYDLGDMVALAYFQCVDPAWRAQKEHAAPGSCADVPTIEKMAIDPEEDTFASAMTTATSVEVVTTTTTTRVAQRPGCEIYQPCFKN